MSFPIEVFTKDLEVIPGRTYIFTDPDAITPDGYWQIIGQVTHSNQFRVYLKNAQIIKGSRIDENVSDLPLNRYTHRILITDSPVWGLLYGFIK